MSVDNHPSLCFRHGLTATIAFRDGTWLFDRIPASEQIDWQTRFEVYDEEGRNGGLSHDSLRAIQADLGRYTHGESISREDIDAIVGDGEAYTLWVDLYIECRMAEEERKKLLPPSPSPVTTADSTTAEPVLTLSDTSVAVDMS